MRIAGAEIATIEWADPYGGTNDTYRKVTFSFRTQEQVIEIPVWLDGSTDELQIVPDARAKLYEILQGLADHTKQWLPQP